jgi:hypothetical protein
MKRALPVALILVACGGPPAPDNPAPVGSLLAQERPLPPAGYGTLRQDDIAVRIQTANLQMQLLPLDEEILRLLASDSYRSLTALRDSRGAAIEAAKERTRVADPRLMFVTIFGKQPQVRFDPQQLFIASGNVFFRPLEIVPLSPGWSEQRVSPREQASAIYLFEPAIRLFEPFDVQFEGAISRQWGQSVRRLEDERSRVLARWRAENPDSTPPR